MSLSSNFPTIRPSLLLDFANVGRLDPRVTFTRATTATYYDGVTTAKAEENLLIFSQEFNAAAWLPSQVTVAANSETAPDGTVTADTITEDTTTNFHRVASSGFSTINGLPYSISIFFKKGTRNFAQIFLSTGFDAANVYANFDIDAGTVGTVGSAANATIVSAGNGWFRCTLTATANASATASASFAVITSSTAARAQSYLGTNSTIFVWGAQVEQRSSVTAYTATTTQAITNYIPVLQTAQSNVPRFDHNPTTGAALGLLIEEQRTNSITYSADFGNAAWTKDECSVTANAIVAPDGTLTGDIVIANTAALQHQVRQTITLAASTTYTISVYAKAGGENLIGIGVGGNVKPITTNFDLSTLTFSGDVSVGGTIVSKSFTPISNGWNRISLVFTTDSSGTVPNLARISPRGFALTPGDGYSGIYIWGAQLEAGAFATSYIPTTTTALTRNADVASMTGTNFSSWYNASEGTVFCQYFPNAVGPATIQQTAFSISDGTIQNEMELFKRANADVSTRFRVWDSGNNQVDFNLGTFTATNNKSAVVYKTDDFAGILNNGSVLTDASGIVPSAVNRLNIGSDQGSVNQLNGCISRLAYYPTRLTNAQLQALTG